MSRETLRKRLEAATPGPWGECGSDIDHDDLLAQGINPPDAAGLGCQVDGPEPPILRGDYGNHYDAALIAHARQDLPALLAVADAAAALYDPLDDGEFYRWQKRLADALAAVEALP